MNNVYAVPESDMDNIYAAPESDLKDTASGNRSGGNIEDAIAGNIEISMTGTLGEAWRNLKGFKLQCMGAFILYMIAAVLTSLVSPLFIFALTAIGADEASAALVGFILQMVTGIIIIPMFMAIHIMGMRHAENKPVSAASVFSYFNKIPSVFLCYLISIVMIMLGLVLLILPGIYLMIAYMYAMPLVVEKNLPAWQALEISRKAVTRKWFPMFGLLMILGIINMLAVFTLGIAWIWTAPLSVLTMSMIYTKLFGAEPLTLAD